MNVCCHSARGGESNQLALAVSVAKRGLGEDEGKGAMRSCVLLLLMGDAISFSLLPQREREIEGERMI